MSDATRKLAQRKEAEVEREVIVNTRDESAIAVSVAGSNICVEVRNYTSLDDGAVAYRRMWAVLDEREADGVINAIMDCCDELRRRRAAKAAAR